jgi:uncharacterized protein YcbX
MMTPLLSAIRIYPIKSTAPQAVESATVEPRGLAQDRRWMLVDEDNRFLTGRRFPVLTQVQAGVLADGLALSAPGQTDLEVPTPTEDQRTVSVWRDSVAAYDAGNLAAAWFRPVDPGYVPAGGPVSFADGFPLLLIGEASLADLNSRLTEPVSMWRFRPNLVFTGAQAFAEDDWRRIAIGEVHFDVVKPCARCVFTTVDPASGEKHPDGEPLRTLTSFRRHPELGVLFGQNLVARNPGIVQHGDPIQVLDP